MVVWLECHNTCCLGATALTARRHWFRVGDSVAVEHWSNDVLATLIRLQGHMNTRWARDGLEPDQACTCTLAPSLVMQICGKRRTDTARKLLSSLAKIVSVFVAHGGKVDETSKRR